MEQEQSSEKSRTRSLLRKLGETTIYAVAAYSAVKFGENVFQTDFPDGLEVPVAAAIGGSLTYLHESIRGK